MRHNVKWWVSTLLLAAGAWSAAAEEDYHQYRVALNLKLLDTEHVDFLTYGEYRWTDSSTLQDAYLLSERIQLDFFKNLLFGINYTYQDVETVNPKTHRTHWQLTHRAEFEANPHWEIASNVVFRIRNRYEHRWIEDAQPNDRTRHRPEIIITTPRLSPLRSVFMNDEVFYDWDKHRLAENRFTPLGLEWALAGPVGLRTFYFWDHFRLGNHWRDGHVFYTVFDVSMK